MAKWDTIEQAEEKEEPVSDYIDEKGFEVLYHEYDCGKPCTENGCPGHESSMPIGFWLDGITFFVEGVERGDFPLDASHSEQVRRVLEKLTIVGGVPVPMLNARTWKDED